MSGEKEKRHVSYGNRTIVYGWKMVLFERFRRMDRDKITGL
ncbi:hypothetical protein [Lactonifactor longoviformis]|nr:hypothetical protein [Lactonifactor longoviformis]